jgi:activator of 2-hydroxyglutaryl-CoA dehydratase
MTLYQSLGGWAVIDIEDRDSDLIACGENRAFAGIITNDKCDTGIEKSFEMVTDTISETVVSIRTTGTCTVFAKSEIVSLLASGPNHANAQQNRE